MNFLEKGSDLSPWLVRTHQATINDPDTGTWEILLCRD
jgi:hypothetical protein